MSKSPQDRNSKPETEPRWRREGLTFEQILERLVAACGGTPRGGRKKVRDGGTKVRWYSYVWRRRNYPASKHQFDLEALRVECARLDLKVEFTPAEEANYTLGEVLHGRQFQEAFVYFPPDLKTTVTVTVGMKEVCDFITSTLGKPHDWGMEKHRRYLYTRFHMRSRGYVLYKVYQLGALKVKEECRHQLPEFAALGVLLDRLDEWPKELVSYEWVCVKRLYWKRDLRYSDEVLPGTPVVERCVPLTDGNGTRMVRDSEPNAVYVARRHLEIRVYQG